MLTHQTQLDVEDDCIKIFVQMLAQSPKNNLKTSRGYTVALTVVVAERMKLMISVRFVQSALLPITMKVLQEIPLVAFHC